MRAVGYAGTGGIDVLTTIELPVREPGEGEVRVRIITSGVNPTDWKSRNGAIHMPIPDGHYQVPHLDGSGIVDAVGPGVDRLAVGQRVWMWLVAFKRLEGTAQEFAVIPHHLAQPLPAHASFELGACLGVPLMTAHRALTLLENGPKQLAPDSLAGIDVLVAGGAGAVGNAAIQLARWAGANVITTVSSDKKATLASAAGAHHVVNYAEQDAIEAVRALAPEGVSIIVEVSPAANADLDAAVLKTHGVVAIYANNGGNEFTVKAVRMLMATNAAWHLLLLYTMPRAALDAAVAAINEAVSSGALGVGDDFGLPLHHYSLDDVSGAHRAVQDGAIGKVLVDVQSP